MPVESANVLVNNKPLLSLVLHILYGLVLEKSKVYYPYTFGRNALFIRTDLYKFYVSICFMALGIPYILSKMTPHLYTAARSSVLTRYKNHLSLDVQVGGYLLGLSMLLTGFCPSFLPIYLATNPLVFLYGVITSYSAYAGYYIYEKILLNRIRQRPIDLEQKNIPAPASEKETLFNIERTITLSICVLILLIFEVIEQSLPPGHAMEELHELIHNRDYIPPGLTGVLCGLVISLLVFVCQEHQTLTSEWMVNIFYYTSDLSDRKSKITGRLCAEQLLKVLAMAFGARVSLWLSSEQEVPTLDWLFYPLVMFGSFISAFSVCLTTATFTDHVYLVNGFVGNVTSDVVPIAMVSGCIIVYVTQLLGITNLQ